MEFVFRPFSRQDFPRLMAWAISPEFVMQWTGGSFNYPLEEAQLEAHLQSAGGEAPVRKIFSVWMAEDGRHVGHIELDHINLLHRSASISRVLIGEPELRGKGIGQAVVRKVLQIGFEELGLHRIELLVFDFNTAAIHCYEKVGFCKEGHLREARRVGEEYWSLYRMSILEQEWRQRKGSGNVK